MFDSQLVPTLIRDANGNLKFVHKNVLKHQPWIKCHVLLRCATSMTMGIFEGQHQVFGEVLGFAGLTPCGDEGSLLQISGRGTFTSDNARCGPNSVRNIVLHSQQARVVGLDRRVVAAALEHSNKGAESFARLASKVKSGCQFP